MKRYWFLVSSTNLTSIMVMANNEEEARRKLRDGIWSCEEECDVEYDYDNARLEEIED